MSGIYIKDMEMPTSCGECKAFVCYKQWSGDVGDCFCGITKNDAVAKTKNADCPLIPVPPHGRLIDADALMKTCGMATDCYDCPNGEHGWCKRSQDSANICEAIEDAPTIIPAEEGET